MDTDYIIRMANQIADALGINPDQEQAVAELADHLTRFWEPRMRSALLAAAVDPGLRAQLTPLVTLALDRIAAVTV
ncbi:MULTISPECIES: formate dehydrogenase subunit delta [Zoogloea]|jgi:formate dehydrogenase subunit delta|uniref:formate dehydrogenase subunit delta n=1 Tax=Zoogloea TaxID=349 RepID=UPI002587D084|nr:MULTISPECIES: formate dehydrogenase subunit delta [Zoogloea]MDD2669692.1 formate dehydrogenase subunit delta [Zoogloea sp.]MDY0034493.1 formate dehydrogenase subunit delta [Zoogloea oleivorans]